MTSMLCEQGDMGLWNTPVSQQDQQLLESQQTQENSKKETEADK